MLVCITGSNVDLIVDESSKIRLKVASVSQLHYVLKMLEIDDNYSLITSRTFPSFSGTESSDFDFDINVRAVMDSLSSLFGFPRSKH